MEPYIQISFLNDFIFCPRSIYFHQLYGGVSPKLYHTTHQIKGLNAHKTIDTQTYTTAKTVLQGMEVYSEKYNLCGKIDTYDSTKKLLTERKKKIKAIYDGYIFQVYAQYFCLIEMGYQVEKITLYSMDDNKSYGVDLPHHNTEKLDAFEQLITDIQSFDLNADFIANANKCQSCVYNALCDHSLFED